jgi:hypothetical protein
MTDRIKATEDGSMGGGFRIMEEGEYTLVFQDGIKYTEDKETGEKTETLMFPMKDAEGNGKISIFCPLDDEFNTKTKNLGFKRLCNILIFSGIHKLIEKERPKIGDLLKEGWTEEDLKSNGLLKTLQVKLPNRVVGAEITHSKSGDKTYANVTKIFEAGDTPSPAPETTESSDSDEGWS